MAEDYNAIIAKMYPGMTFTEKQKVEIIQAMQDAESDDKNAASKDSELDEVEDIDTNKVLADFQRALAKVGSLDCDPCCDAAMKHRHRSQR